MLKPLWASWEGDLMSVINCIKAGMLLVLGTILFFPATLRAERLSIENVNSILDGKSLYKHYCQVCHGAKGNGKGVNAKNVDPPPADFTDTERMVNRSDGKLFKIISRGGRGAALSKNMPPWGKTLTEEQIWSLVGYVRTFSNTIGENAAAYRKTAEPVSIEGNKKCTVCHSPDMKTDIIAPDLGYERSKFTRNWLVGFLKKPIKIRPVGYMPLTKSKMPNFQFSDLDAEALVEYLLHREESVSEDTIVAESGSIDLSPAMAKKGRKLFRKFGCIGCHKINKKGGEVGPNLTKSAHRLKPYWVFKWLKNPQLIRPDAPMPNFGLKDKQIKQLVAYLMELKEESPFPVTPLTTTSGMSKEQLYQRGKGIVKRKNCLGCHYMHTGSDKGYKTKEPIVDEINLISKK